MANSCLVTKLKDSIDNTDLLKLGEFKLKSKFVNAPNTHVRILTPGVTFTDGTTEVDLTTSNPQKTLTEVAEIAILDNYALEKLIIPAVGEFDISSLKYRPSLNYFEVYDANYQERKVLRGDIGVLSERTYSKLYLKRQTLIIGELKNVNVATLVLTGCNNVSGNLANLASMNITSLQIQETKISGSIESFVANLRTLGRSTGSVDIFTNAEIDITFNGSPIGKAEGNGIIWQSNPNKITFKGVTIDA